MDNQITSNRNLTLLTDFYELTMMYGYFKHGKQDEIATFDVFFRPFEESNFCIAAGLQQAVEYIESIHFGEEEIDYLRSTNAFDEEFLAWLADFKFTGTVKAIPEGTVVFPFEPLMTVTAPICQAQLLEAALLNIINFQTLIATKARRICYAASPASVLEFGLRRAQAPDASIYGARAAVIGGCSSTSNVLCAQMFGMDPKGTHAHSWVMSFPTELDAFMAYADTYPNNCLLLVDTYDTLTAAYPTQSKCSITSKPRVTSRSAYVLTAATWRTCPSVRARCWTTQDTPTARFLQAATSMNTCWNP